MTTTGVVWTLSNGHADFLELPPGNVVASPVAASSDGSVIVGQIQNDFIPGRWANTGLTSLVSLAGIVTANLCSQNGSVIAGYGSGVGAYWTSDGAVGDFLPLLPGASAGTTTVVCMSNDGSIVVGTMVITTTRNACYWTNGTSPTALPNSRGSAFVSSCSNDGSVIAGWNFDNDPHLPCYWVGGTQRMLELGSFTDAFTVACNSDGSIIWGVASDNTQFYWDNLNSSSGGFYGTIHALGGSLGDIMSGWANTVNVVAGTASTIQGVKWNGTSQTMLPLLTGWASSTGAAISGDGSVVAGNTTLDNSAVRAVYWDAGNAAHVLRVPYTTTSSIGISRDGSTIFGLADPPTPYLSMDSLLAFSLTSTPAGQPVMILGS